MLNTMRNFLPEVKIALFVPICLILYNFSIFFHLLWLRLGPYMYR